MTAEVKKVIEINFTDRKHCDSVFCEGNRKGKIKDWLENTNLIYCECGASRYCSKECMEKDKTHELECKEKKLMPDSKILRKIEIVVNMLKGITVEKDGIINVADMDGKVQVKDQIRDIDMNDTNIFTNHFVLKERYPKNVIVHITHTTQGDRLRYWTRCLIYPERK